MPRGCWTACWGCVGPSGSPWYGPFTRPWQLFRNSIRAGRFTWKSGSGKLREAQGSILGLAEPEWAYRRARPGQNPPSEALSKEPARPEVSGRTWAHLDSASQWASVVLYSHPLCALSTLHGFSPFRILDHWKLPISWLCGQGSRGEAMCRRCQPDHHPLQAPACRQPSLLPLHFPNSALAPDSPSDLQVSPPKPLPGEAL